MLKIRKHVPLSPIVRLAPPARRKYPFEQMDVGDMFFVPSRTKNTIATHVSTVGKKLGRKFASRMTYAVERKSGWIACAKDDRGAVLGIGVWRTK